jgi:N-acetylmuramoyl-L-alanine amidase
MLYKLPIELWEYNGKSIRTTLGIKEWKTAVRIENYNKNAKETGLRDDNFIASRQLWVPHHELHCTEEAKEKIEAEAAPVLTGGEPIAAKTTRTFPIFGKKYENTPQLSQKLKGRVYYIVSGHGGPDTGAQGTRSNHTLCEDEYAYDVSLRLVRLLISHGATAYMIVRDDKDGIRDEDYLVCDKNEKVWGNKTIPLDQKQRLQQRCDVINVLSSKHGKAGALEQTFIEIHVDSRSRNMKTDVFFYHSSNSEVGKKLALRFHQTFLQKYMKTRSQRSYSGTVSARDLYMLRNTNIPRKVYVELGNIRNDYDQQRLVIRSNRQALANWMYEALVAK